MQGKFIYFPFFKKNNIKTAENWTPCMNLVDQFAAIVRKQRTLNIAPYPVHADAFLYRLKADCIFTA